MVIPTEAGSPRSAESRAARSLGCKCALHPCRSTRLQLTSGIVETREAALKAEQTQTGDAVFGRFWKV